jgi:hypothetical protein
MESKPKKSRNPFKFRLSCDARDVLARASLGQMWMARAPANLVITAEYARISGKYGDRGVRYAMIGARHVGQNIFLQAEATLSLSGASVCYKYLLLNDKGAALLERP